MYTYVYAYLYICIYVYICVYVCVCVCVLILTKTAAKGRILRRIKTDVHSTTVEAFSTKSTISYKLPEHCGGRKATFFLEKELAM